MPVAASKALTVSTSRPSTAVNFRSIGFTRRSSTASSPAAALGRSDAHPVARRRRPPIDAPDLADRVRGYDDEDPGFVEASELGERGDAVEQAGRSGHLRVGHVAHVEEAEHAQRAVVAGARERRDELGVERDRAVAPDVDDRVVAGMEGTPLVDSKSKRLIAYHEIGHAIVGTLLKDHDPVQKVTLIPRGQAQGLTWFTPNEEQGLITRAQLKARITGALGGRAAEEEIFGYSEVTTGAGGDLQQVTMMARQMVTRFGMSDLGPLSLEEQGNEVFLGGWMSTRSEYSEKISAKIDSQVEQIVKDCHDKARQIIRENRVVIDYLVELLIEKETIDGDQLLQIMNENKQLDGEKLVVSG